MNMSRIVGIGLLALGVFLVIKNFGTLKSATGL